jgi:hypothetical protein
MLQLQPTTAKLNISSTLVATNILKMPQRGRTFLICSPYFPFFRSLEDQEPYT